MRIPSKHCIVFNNRWMLIYRKLRCVREDKSLGYTVYLIYSEVVVKERTLRRKGENVTS